jgi:hypothetical protein
MFRLWQSQRRREQNEPRQVLEQLADFIDRHGDSRFSPATATMIATITLFAIARVGGTTMLRTVSTCSRRKVCVKHLRASISIVL